MTMPRAYFLWLMHMYTNTIPSTEDVHHYGALQGWRAVSTAQEKGLLQRRGMKSIDCL